MRVPRYFKREIMRGTYSTPHNSSEASCSSFFTFWLIVLGIFIFIGFLGITLSDIILKQHEHIYSEFGESTSTCNFIGETTYWCVYHYDDNYNCNKKKVVKDTKYANCDYVISSKISHTIEKIEYLTKCKSCGNTRTKTVYNVFGRLGSNKIYDTTNEYDIAKENFRSKALFQTNPYPKNLYAIVHFFDKDGNWIGYAWARVSCTNSGSALVSIDLKNDFGIPSTYYEHRWELSYERPYGDAYTFIGN